MFGNKTSAELLQLSKQIVQPLSQSFHKGQAGRVLVIGGCDDYTGAPYFAAHSAGLVGSDLTHIVCERSAGPVIKSYSPDLMVHPFLYQLSTPELTRLVPESEVQRFGKLSLMDAVFGQQPDIAKVVDKQILPKLMDLMNRVDVIVAGPGLGRDPLMLRTLVRVIEETKVLNKSLILDADALFLVSLKPELVKGYAKAIITPNQVEFYRIAQKVGIDFNLKEIDTTYIRESTIKLSKKLANLTVVRKGEKDFIVKGDDWLASDLGGSPRRVGGQGDTLVGAIATFSVWADNYSRDVWENDKTISSDEASLLACFAASSLVRVASRLAFKYYGRSMQASNVHTFIGEAYHEFYESDDYVKL